MQYEGTSQRQVMSLLRCPQNFTKFVGGGELDQYLDYFKTLFFSVLIDSLFITFKNKFQNVMENNLINLLAIQRRQIPFDLVYHQ